MVAECIRLLCAGDSVPDMMIDNMLRDLKLTGEDLTVDDVRVRLFLKTAAELLRQGNVKTERTAVALFARAAQAVELAPDLPAEIAYPFYMEAFRKVISRPGELPSQPFAVTVLGLCLPKLEPRFVPQEDTHGVLLTVISSLSLMLTPLTEKKAQWEVLRVMEDHVRLLTLQANGTARLAKYSPALLCALVGYLSRVGPLHLSRAASSALLNMLHMGIVAILQQRVGAQDGALVDERIFRIIRELRVFSQSHIDVDRANLQSLLLACLDTSGTFPVLRAEVARQLAVLTHVALPPTLEEYDSAQVPTDVVRLSATDLAPHHARVFSHLLIREVRELSGNWESDAHLRQVILGASSLILTSRGRHDQSQNVRWQEDVLSHLFSILTHYLTPLLALKGLTTEEDREQRLRDTVTFMQRMSTLATVGDMPLLRPSPLLCLFHSLSLKTAFNRTRDIAFAQDLRELVISSCNARSEKNEDAVAVLCRVLLIEQAVDLHVRLPATFLSLLLPSLLALQTDDHDLIHSHASSALAKIVEASRRGNLDGRDYIAEACLNHLKFAIVDPAMLIVIMGLLKTTCTISEKLAHRCAEEVLLHVQVHVFDSAVLHAFLAYFASLLHERLPPPIERKRNENHLPSPSSYCRSICKELGLQEEDSSDPATDASFLPDATSDAPAEGVNDDSADVAGAQRWQEFFADALMLLSSLLLHDDHSIANNVCRLLCDLVQYQVTLTIQPGAWVCLWHPLLQRLEDEVHKFKFMPMRPEQSIPWQLLRQLLDADVAMSHSVRQQLKRLYDEAVSSHSLEEDEPLLRLGRHLSKTRRMASAPINVSHPVRRPTWAAVSE